MEGHFTFLFLTVLRSLSKVTKWFNSINSLPQAAWYVRKMDPLICYIKKKHIRIEDG